MDRLPLDANGHVLPSTEVVVLRPIGDGEPVFLGCDDACAMCGERPGSRIEITGETARVITPCPCPNGITTTITLSVPSGRIIISDDLRPIYDGFDHDGFANYNSILGQAQVIQAMAKLGCAFGSVGNTCPGLYRDGVDRYIIASPPPDEDEALGMDECLAGIITDLWAYSIADHDDWLARGGGPHANAAIVNVTPGVYQFTHHTGERGFDPNAAGTVIFAHVAKVS